MNVSIVIPLHKPEVRLMNKIKNSLKNQKFNGKKEIIFVKDKGLAEAYNYGIKKAKYDTIVTLHQDCVPISKKWLINLIKPLTNKDVVATTGAVYDVENKMKYYPYLDGKNCAYKKEKIADVGYFDDRTFLNSGEDMDMYIKLKKIGIISKSDCFVKHFHKGYLKNKSPYKTKQNANTYGCLFRIYGFKLPGWWKALIRAHFFFDISYFYWFWRGFILRKEDFKN